MKDEVGNRRGGGNGEGFPVTKCFVPMASEAAYACYNSQDGQVWERATGDLEESGRHVMRGRDEFSLARCAHCSMLIMLKSLVLRADAMLNDDR